MSYIKSLINKNLEQFKQNIETSLYTKLADKLDEVKKDVAANIYNEGTCVPCGKKINEATNLDDAQDACDKKKEECIDEWNAMDRDDQKDMPHFKQQCNDKHHRCYEEAAKRFGK